MMKKIVRVIATSVAGLSLVLQAVPAIAASSAISIGTVTPTSVTVGASAVLTANVSSSAGNITSCSLYVDNDDKGAMTVAAGKATKPFMFASSQIYTVFVFCRDEAGNFNSGPNASVWAQAGSGGGGDISPPVVGSVSPASASAGSAVMFSVIASDSGGVASCTLFISGVDQGAMTVVGGTATKSYAFSQTGTFTAYAQCKDTAGNTGTGANTAVVVSAAQAGPTEGSLLKLECPSGATSDHPCKAVYYYGKDGKRHAFPNDKVYFTWYADFDSVVTVTGAELAAITLGKNVTYRPGSRMVKFPTVPQVYAVAKGGVLRWVKTEDDAKTLYGTDWSKKIDDLSEAFFFNYSYGTDISSTYPFSVTGELQGAQTIDQTL